MIKKSYPFTSFPTKKHLAVLIDPDKADQKVLFRLITQIPTDAPVIFLVGGSLLSKQTLDETVAYLKEHSSFPVFLFPGGATQVSPEADGIFLLSLVSGRNPEFLIGQHVIAAPILAQSELEIVSTAYLLIDGGNRTSVEYMSNTVPIPRDKKDIAVATALAAQMIGMKQIYLEAGSGAKAHVPVEMIREVKQHTQLPLIVGGGIRTATTAQQLLEAGADMLVVGTAIEQNPAFLEELLSCIAVTPAV
ncbi:geranylgeranylglyceryl/heptaprenylglyceryl phosphate synthase [Algivirga pacifica]|uniref:Geranylgeranylglyceryl phosphate synthase n=1 Tax=Algivirga pacifica TaxID=1162670 RepID=A0ABP9DL00_9BACT